ncbi:MAG: TrkH family potassium uptake protein [Desulfohalobiaceae bacterium]|nr:TrkH family potassium uptake protein [Desulfohalobiaceae bacterium]
MHWRYTLRILGIIICFSGLSMLVPLAWSLYSQDGLGPVFLLSIALSTGLGLLLYVPFRRQRVDRMSHREGMAVVALGWIGCGLFGALPFYLSGSFAGFTDSVFETFSGFTTTGASILTNIEALPRSLLLWRSLTHWLGGMGIILLSLAILPLLGVGGMQLYKAEVPGPTPDKLRPRIKDTALLLWKVYVLFSALEIALLWLGGMNLFDSICHTFGTMATGGFSTKNASIGHYTSPYIQMVITLFMFIAGVNFALHFKMLQGRLRVFGQDPEFRFFALFILIVTAIISFTVWGQNYQGLGEAFRYSIFQAVSITTTTGYATADFELWAPLTQILLFFAMFMGGCAGSTGGGIKCMRIMVLLKQAGRELTRLVHPRAVISLKFGGRPLSEDVISGIWGYFILYLLLACLAIVGLSALGVDVLTSIAAVIACISNIGPGLGQVGPADNYAGIPIPGKWLLTFCMLLGRLEIYTVIILLFPGFWRK